MEKIDNNRLLNQQNRSAALAFFKHYISRPQRNGEDMAFRVAIAALETFGKSKDGCNGCAYRPEYPACVRCHGCSRRYEDRYTPAKPSGTFEV